MSFESVLVTGGAGFIGSNFIRTLLASPEFFGRVINLDLLTYAGNLKSLTDVNENFSEDRYIFRRADIRDIESVRRVFEEFQVDTVVHFAAESHVDRSILGPRDFIETNITGTFNLLETARSSWNDYSGKRFHHVSTDEVYGSLGETGYFYEDTPYDPRSPYSASKASSDHLVRSYYHTYGLPVTISNCSNNYGPYQFPEKLIPLMIHNILKEKELPVYGDGKYIRDWLYVDDHNQAIIRILQDGKTGETWNIGGDNEWENIKLIHVLCEKIATLTGKESGYYEKLITYVKDRPGHDRRYSINCEKIKNELGWKQSVTFDQGLDRTIAWYMNNSEWVDEIVTGEYRTWVETQYGN